MSDIDPLRAALPAYDFGDVLGRGAWGIVVAARHRKLDRDVAVKWLPVELTQDPSVRQRFAAEARTLAALDHPHVVRIHDYVEDGEVCALVMERLTGGTLAQRMRLGTMPAEIASAIEIGALYGLEHAHQHNVLHRDIKPENLMFGADGLLKITDFGIATVLGDQAERLTAAGMAMGTPAYMAPEQLTDASSIGPATDIWSAGAVYYEMLCGDVPYPSKGTLHSSLLARAQDPPRPLGEVNSTVPPPLAKAAMRALDRDVDRRWTSSGEFAEGLEAAGTQLWGKDWLASTSVPVFRTKRRASSAGTVGVATVPAAPTSHRRRNVLVAATVLALAAGATVTAIATSSSSNPKPKPGKTVTSTLGAIPAGWGNTLQFAVSQPGDSTRPVATHFGAGTAGMVTFIQDPADKLGWEGKHGGPSALDLVEQNGYNARYDFYEQLIVGRGIGNEVPVDQLSAFIQNKKTMALYWADVVSFLTSLHGLSKPISVVVDAPVSSLIESLNGPPNPNLGPQIPVSVASSGVAALASYPNTFAGWNQAWVGLRNKLAPKVRLGLTLNDYGPGNYLVPTNGDPRPTLDQLDQWAVGFGTFYASFGVKYDYLNYTVAYGDHGYFATTANKPSYMPNAQDLLALLRWVGDVNKASHLRVVLDDVPVGNTISPVMNNTNYHWKDVYAQWIFAAGYPNLTKLRNAGVIGINFGGGSAFKEQTCACDADVNQVDDDGGYLAQQLNAYSTAGGISLS